MSTGMKFFLQDQNLDKQSNEKKTDCHCELPWLGGTRGHSAKWHQLVQTILALASCISLSVTFIQSQVFFFVCWGKASVYFRPSAMHSLPQMAFFTQPKWNQFVLTILTLDASRKSLSHTNSQAPVTFLTVVKKLSRSFWGGLLLRYTCP